MSKTAIRTEKRIGIFAIVGVLNTIFDYILFMFLAMLFANEVASVISATFAMFIAFLLHSKFTWRDRKTSRTGIIQFLIINICVFWGIRTLIVWGLTNASTGWLEPLFRFAHWVLRFLPYEFVVRTGIFAITTIITLTLTYILYNKIVFRRPVETKRDDSAD